MIVGQGAVGFVALFAAVNLVLSLSTFRGEDSLSRTVHELSASQNAKFGIDTHPERLSAEIALFDPNAYDFPSSGEALHEMTRITKTRRRSPRPLRR